MPVAGKSTIVTLEGASKQNQSDAQGKDHLQNVVEVYDANLFDELFFHDKYMTSRPANKEEVTAGEHIYGKDFQEDNVAHVQIVVNGKREDLDGATPEQFGTIQSFPAFRGKDVPYQVSKMIDLGQLAITPTLSELEGYLEKGTYSDHMIHRSGRCRGIAPPNLLEFIME